MTPFVADLLNSLEQLHADIDQAIADLPLEALDWKPAADMNSICVLIVHLTGAERFWIGDVATQDPSNRVRDAEFVARGLSAGELAGRLAATLAYARQALALLPLQDLEQRRRLPGGDGREFTIGWCLLHALEHTATHTGHIQLMSDLWKQKLAGGQP